MNGHALVWHAPEKLTKEDLMTPKRIRTAVIGLAIVGQLLAATTAQAVYPARTGVSPSAPGSTATPMSTR